MSNEPGPMASAAAECLFVNSEGELALAEDKLAELGDQLASYFGKPTLLAAVADLLLFAEKARDKPGGKRVADTLLSVATGATQALRALGGRAEQLADQLERVQRTADSWLAFSGTPAKPQATGAKTAGTVSGLMAAASLANWQASDD